MTTRIWDPFVRLFHWALVLLIAFSWWSGEQHDMENHRLSGYAILALLVFRLAWGFVGPRTARFTGFVRGPGAVTAYARTLGNRAPHHADGHNPLGGWSVVAMLAVLLAMVTAGLFAVDVDGLESGPLADYVSFDQGRTAAQAHELIFNVILVLVALHVIAVAFYLLWKRHNLARAMVTGQRPLGEGETAQDLRWSWIGGLACLAVGVGVAWAVSKGFRF
ncbi:Ni/Fe-hydrogenase 1 b-type cytochrome subunit [Novosphingobium sp. Rr 2-17]|uniref:cytochrome b/b6 domain-containing protein n=1 Tax=Novosphingobium sp. Rr 2-17 TaxID=555793 RepID=UPI000269980E|nr:cytochrome b/b6 domain-containing protein [Novosphingobium sp. Rr 2-17]EIZ81054.1 Ni/Fe-hydrogenase 1 b-type cytochrome subunit [Novosphingobium sp. Rr 2-17]